MLRHFDGEPTPDTEIVMTGTVPPPVDLDQLRDDRRERLQSAIAEADIDVLILTSPESIQYATGYRSVSADLFRAHQMAAVVTAEDCRLIVPAGDAAAAVDSGFPVEDLVRVGTFYYAGPETDDLTTNAHNASGVLDAIRQALLDLRRSSRVCVERSRMLPELDTEASTDATEFIQSVRTIKLPAEVDLIRHATHLAEQGIQAAAAVARPGITEHELALQVACTMVEGGAEPRFVVATTGPRTALADAFATDREWLPGELARFDVGCRYEGYWSDVGRTFVLGEPTPLQRDTYAAIHAGEDEQLRLIRDGVHSSEVFDIAIQTVNDRGLPYERHHCGHGIGLAIYEPPIIAAANGSSLRSGMTINVETPYYQLGWAGMMVEDTVLVTSDGHLPLTKSSRDLQVIPI